jgi:hypothetical protein
LIRSFYKTNKLTVSRPRPASLNVNKANGSGTQT